MPGGGDLRDLVYRLTRNLAGSMRQQPSSTRAEPQSAAGTAGSGPLEFHALRNALGPRATVQESDPYGDMMYQARVQAREHPDPYWNLSPDKGGALPDDRRRNVRMTQGRASSLLDSLYRAK